MAFRKFEDMEVWQIGRGIVKTIYDMTRQEPFARDYALKVQMQRAAVSICSNIAEGFARRGNKEFQNFLWIAKGSAAEVQSQLYHAQDVGYIDQDAFSSLYDELHMIQVKLYRLMQTISSCIDKQKSLS